MVLLEDPLQVAEVDQELPAWLSSSRQTSLAKDQARLRSLGRLGPGGME